MKNDKSDESTKVHYQFDVLAISNEELNQASEVIEVKIVNEKKGYILKYDLNYLIDEIVINPWCHEKELIEFERFAKVAGLNSKIRRSSVGY